MAAAFECQFPCTCTLFVHFLSPKGKIIHTESVGRKFILKGGSDKAATPNKQYPTPYDWAR